MHARSLTKKVIFHESFPAKVLKHNGVKLFMKSNHITGYFYEIQSNQNVMINCVGFLQEQCTKLRSVGLFEEINC